MAKKSINARAYAMANYLYRQGVDVGEKDERTRLAALRFLLKEQKRLVIQPKLSLRPYRGAKGTKRFQSTFGRGLMRGAKKIPPKKRGILDLLYLNAVLHNCEIARVPSNLRSKLRREGVRVRRELMTRNAIQFCVVTGKAFNLVPEMQSIGVLLSSEEGRPNTALLTDQLTVVTRRMAKRISSLTDSLLRADFADDFRKYYDRVMFIREQRDVLIGSILELDASARELDESHAVIALLSLISFDFDEALREKWLDLVLQYISGLEAVHDNEELRDAADAARNCFDSELDLDSDF